MTRKSPIILGEKYGKLKALRLHSFRDQHRVFECQCECNKILLVKGIYLKSGHTKSCGCYDREKTIERNTLKSGESSFNYILCYYKRNAKRRNKNFELTKEEFRKIIESPCFYCTLAPNMSTKRPTSGRTNGFFIHNGIDRKNNELGYTLQNSVTCCKICNRAKGTLKFEEYVKWIQFIKRSK